jgi:cyclophilin family peptidyl-prolyl cis-trans isomerase
MRLLITCALGATLLLAACGGDSKKTSTPTADNFDKSAATTPGATSAATKAAATPAATTSTATTPAAAPTQAGGKKTYSARPPLTIDANKKYFATIKMDIGDIKLELYPKDAPEHVNSFVFLAKEGFYDGVTFHRVIPGFVAQAGDPTGTGRGGPGYTVPDEVNSHKFLDGSLGMAKTAAPNSAGSQWFIDYAPQTALDGGYTVFGQLISGRDVLDKIKPRDPATATTPGTVINSIVIDEQ